MRVGAPLYSEEEKQAKECVWMGMGGGNLSMQIVSHKYCIMLHKFANIMQENCREGWTAVFILLQ